MRGEEFFLILATIVAATTVVHGAFRMIGKYLETKLRLKMGGKDDEHLIAEIDEMKQKLHHHQDVEERVAELEERLEFAERLLAKKEPRVLE
ncbi:MAG: hypothetical protein OEY63_06815 [Gemmatimonadota bacterium]|nr:hypothetical protein [Gemmatimonadota bacterium]MDH5805297.1 hypothetical protein [Gemmatimonadota bacterium]